MEFERTTRRTMKSLPLVPMIDVMFILIIFFMLTTTFMKIESLELLLPSVSNKVAQQKDDTLRLFIKPDGNMVLGQRPVSADGLSASLARMFSEDPSARIMLLAANGVSMQQLVNVMDRVHMAGGRSLFVRKWEDVPSSGSRRK